MTLSESVKATLARRAALVAELADIDAQLAVAREALGVVPPPEGMLKTCPVCGLGYTRTSPRQKMCPDCTKTQPHRPVEVLAKRREADVDLCRKPVSGLAVVPAPPESKEPERPVESPIRRLSPRREEEFETVWTPGRDAPSLTGGAPGLGATLSRAGRE